MEITAIAIYDLNNLENGLPKKLQQAPKSNSITLFQSDYLKNFEEITLKSLTLPKSGGIFWLNINNEYHYMQELPDHRLAVIISRKDLHPNEDQAVNYLLINIKHAFIRPNAVNTTIDQIQASPLLYINKDLHTGTILKNIEETKAVAMNNIDKILERGEKLTDLQKKTVDLKEDAFEFRRRAEDLNKCRC